MEYIIHLHFYYLFILDMLILNQEVGYTYLIYHNFFFYQFFIFLYYLFCKIKKLL